MASFSESPRDGTDRRQPPRLRAELVAVLAVLAYIVSIAIGVAR